MVMLWFQTSFGVTTAVPLINCPKHCDSCQNVEDNCPIGSVFVIDGDPCACCDACVVISKYGEACSTYVEADMVSGVAKVKVSTRICQPGLQCISGYCNYRRYGGLCESYFSGYPYQMKCDINNNFNEVQCSTTHCWCVDSLTGAAQRNSKVPIPINYGDLTSCNALMTAAEISSPWIQKIKEVSLLNKTVAPQNHSSNKDIISILDLNSEGNYTDDDLISDMIGYITIEDEDLPLLLDEKVPLDELPKDDELALHRLIEQQDPFLSQDEFNQIRKVNEEGDIDDLVKDIITEKDNEDIEKLVKDIIDYKADDMENTVDDNDKKTYDKNKNDKTDDKEKVDDHIKRMFDKNVIKDRANKMDNKDDHIKLNQGQGQHSDHIKLNQGQHSDPKSLTKSQDHQGKVDKNVIHSVIDQLIDKEKEENKKKKSNTVQKRSEMDKHSLSKPVGRNVTEKVSILHSLLELISTNSKAKTSKYLRDIKNILSGKNKSVWESMYRKQKKN